jgi:5-methylcytosine-specific restriction protein B
MNKDNNSLYQLWDEFLKQWPVEKVRSMSIEQYTLAGSKDTFTYWLESRLDKMGSIWGGSRTSEGVERKI